MAVSIQGKHCRSNITHGGFAADYRSSQGKCLKSLDRREKMDFWQELAKKMREAGFKDDYISVFLDFFGEIPPGDFLKKSPEKIASDLNTGLKLSFKANPDEAGDILRMARFVHKKISPKKKDQITSVKVSREAQKKPVSIPDIGKTAGLKTDVLKKLKDKKVMKIVDLFKPVNMKVIKSLIPKDQERKRFIAVAKFVALSNHLRLSKKLVDKGIYSVSKLGRMPLTSIESILGELSEEDKKTISLIHHTAKAVDNYIANTSVETERNKSADKNWYKTDKPEMQMIPLPRIDSDEEPQEELCADCDDCHTVFSPFAYIFDLIDFINDNWDIGSKTLTAILFQEIDNLDCETGIEPVLQIILAINVLERFRDKIGIASNINDFLQLYNPVVDSLLRLIDLIFYRTDNKLKKKKEEDGTDVEVDNASSQALLDIIKSDSPSIDTLTKLMKEIQKINYWKIFKLMVDNLLGFANLSREAVENSASGGNSDFRELNDILSLAAPTHENLAQLIEVLGKIYISEGTEGDQTRTQTYSDKIVSIAQEIEAMEKYLNDRIKLIIEPFLTAYRTQLGDTIIAGNAASSIDDLENMLFIDLQNSPCKITTRVTQVIQSLQSFILSIRTGEILQLQKQGHLDSLIRDIDFSPFDEETWHWLRTYATWSSAMYVFVYPENLLIPTMRKTMTPMFEEICDNVVFPSNINNIDLAKNKYIDYLEKIEQLLLIDVIIVQNQLFLFAHIGNDLWMNTMDISLAEWNGWREITVWDPEYIPNIIDIYTTSDEEDKFIIAGSTGNPNGDLKYYLLSKDGNNIEETETTNASLRYLTAPNGSEIKILVKRVDWDEIHEFQIDFDEGISQRPIEIKNSVFTKTHDDKKGYLVCKTNYNTIFIGLIDFRDIGYTINWKAISASVRQMDKYMAKSRILRKFKPLPKAFKHRYFGESYLHFPLLAAWAFNRSGNYPSAHQWYRKVYDPFASSNKQTFPFDQYFTGALDRPENWLLDPLDPHGIAHQRIGVYLRHVILMMVKNLLDWADHEYALANPESINRARELYLLAKHVLDADFLKNPCKDSMGALKLEIEKYGLNRRSSVDDLLKLIEKLKRVNSIKLLSRAIEKIHEILKENQSIYRTTRQIRELVNNALAEESQRKPSTRVLDRHKSNEVRRDKHEVFVMSIILDKLHGEVLAWLKSHKTPFVTSTLFCIPSNPLIKAFHMYIDGNLFKLRHCLTISGEKSPAILLPTGSLEGKAITDTGQLTTSEGNSLTFQPRYRYSYIAEKARQYVGFAQQLGSALLQAIEKRDNEDYNLLQAENAVAIASETVTLKELFVTEAGNAEKVANIQLKKADRQMFFWEERTKNGFMGLSVAETAGMGLMALSGAIQALTVLPKFALTAIGTSSQLAAAGMDATVALAPGGATLHVGGLIAAATGLVAGGQQLAGAFQTFGQLSLTFAGFERRWEEWKLQRDLSQYDFDIAELQKTMAKDMKNIAEQEENIAGIQHQHAKDVLNFLENKESSKELYEWMIDVLKDNYKIIMEIAASTARLAQWALEFERQQKLNYIQGDYWTINAPILTEKQKDYGLLGADRLLADLTRLDNFKLQTDKRFLQLSKTISLARTLPTEFFEFKQTGRIEFNTLMDWFDWDFPGHYLRLIKSVKVTIIALIPPVDGIHAMLANDGTSSVVVNNNGQFTTETAMRTFGESIALDSPYNDTGLFVLDYDDPMYLPFEGLGVATNWTLELPRATNRFNFDTIVDVLFTIDYTALHDESYKNQVISGLSNELSSEVVINLRTNYPDHWYHMKNPTKPAEPQEILINLEPSALPPNLKPESIGVEHLTVIIVSSDSNCIAQLQEKISIFKRTISGGNQIDIDVALRIDEEPEAKGTFIFSTRRPNANYQVPNGVNPDGDWRVKIDPSLYSGSCGSRIIDKINDIILVISVKGKVNW